VSTPSASARMLPLIAYALHVPRHDAKRRGRCRHRRQLTHRYL
jgi:hypothetical protein